VHAFRLIGQVLLMRYAYGQGVNRCRNVLIPEHNGCIEIYLPMDTKGCDNRRGPMKKAGLWNPCSLCPHEIPQRLSEASLRQAWRLIKQAILCFEEWICRRTVDRMAMGQNGDEGGSQREKARSTKCSWPAHWFAWIKRMGFLNRAWLADSREPEGEACVKIGSRVKV